MKTDLKRIFKSGRVILLLLFLLFSLVLINGGLMPHFWDKGVVIHNVVENSPASNAGIENPSQKSTLLSRERIISINGNKISSETDYYEVINNLKLNRTTRIETKKVKANYVLFQTYEEKLYSVDVGNSTNLGLTAHNAPKSNLQKGLDLEGGTRVLLKPVEKASPEDLELTISNLKERLNVYGLKQVVVRTATDLSGQDFILIEIAGVTEDEVKELIAKQGKFEAKISNETVFYGGKKDITYVCRSADCSGIDPNRGCSKVGDGHACSFFFGITLSPEAAERQAKQTDKLTVVADDDGGRFLSDDLILFLDDKEVDSLRIGAELKGRATTDIQISGSSQGRTREEAVSNTLKSMNRLQTIIKTGSLPIKLDVVKMDTISPSLGKEFLNNIFLVGGLVILAVIGVVLVRYRKVKVVLPMILVMISEVILILGFAASTRQSLDLAAIAGIIIVVGTGVDHLIVITDEVLRGEVIYDWKRKIKAAMFIVMGAYLTTCVGMLPLIWAGAGLLRGFAITTIVGISFGVLVARPAYAVIIEKLMRD